MAVGHLRRRDAPDKQGERLADDLDQLVEEIGLALGARQQVQQTLPQQREQGDVEHELQKIQKGQHGSPEYVG